MLRSTLALLLSGITAVVAAADPLLVGSDLLRRALEPTIAGASLGAGRTLQVRFDGSRNALEELRAGRAAIALVVFAPDEPPPEKEFSLVPLGYQIVVFAVNENNPVREVHFGQLGGMFGEKEPLNLRQWGDLGGKGVWALKSVGLNLVAEPDSVGLELFIHAALHHPQLRTTITEHADTQELLRKIRADDNCIGLFLRPLGAAEGVRVLAVARSATDVAFGPSRENIHTGDYPLRLAFHVVFDPRRAGELEPVLGLLLGERVAAALEADGLVAVPVNARAQQRRALGLD